MYLNNHHHHQSVLPKGRSFTAKSDTKAAFLPKGRSSTANSGTKVAVWLGMNRCGSFRCFPHPTLSLASEQTLKYLKSSQGATAWRWGECIWVTKPSGLHRNSPQGLKISSRRVFDQIRDPNHPSPPLPQLIIIIIIIIIIIRVFYPKAGLSLQTQTPRLHFCPKAGRSSIANSGN